MAFKFVPGSRDPYSQARTGTLTTDHGDIPTPVFMPVGTGATVKAVHQRELEADSDARIILGNTYHLHLRPGIPVIRKAGGLHRFMSWNRSILTDSGGYQVFSLSQRRKISEEGVSFQSHIDGARHFLSPEDAIDIQRGLGADIMMAFDECTPYPSTLADARQSMQLTHRWLDRCLERFHATQPLYGHDQALFPIVQGGMHAVLRRESAEVIASKQAAGNAIGGLSVGEPAEVMYEMARMVCDILPADKPRYLMGVGTPANLLECMARGVDMFDCVLPTRNGRNGMLFTSEGILNIRNEKWKEDFSPIDPAGHSFVDQRYSRGYLRHLAASNEILAMQIATLHNLAFYAWLTAEARQRIEAGTFGPWKDKMTLQLERRI